VELDGSGAEHSRQGAAIFSDRLVEPMLLEERVGAGEDRLGLRALVGGDAALQEPGVDPEPESEPLDRLGRRARLAPLDLRDVLLREAIAGEVGLRQTGRHAQLAQALAQARRP